MLLFFVLLLHSILLSVHFYLTTQVTPRLHFFAHIVRKHPVTEAIMDAIASNSEWSSLPPLNNTALTFMHPALPTGETPWFYHREFVHFMPLAGLMYRGTMFMGMCGDVRVPDLDFTQYHHVTSSPPYNVLHSVAGPDNVVIPSYEDQVVFLPNNAQDTSEENTMDMQLDPTDYAQDFPEDESENMPVEPAHHAQYTSGYDTVEMLMDPADDALYIPEIESEYMYMEFAAHAQGISESESEDVHMGLADQAQLISEISSESTDMPLDVAHHAEDIPENESEDMLMDLTTHAHDINESENVDIHLNLAGPVPQNGIWEIDVDDTMSHEELERAAHLQDQILALVDN